MMNIDTARFNMVHQQIQTWNVLDGKLLDLLMSVKREEFVAKDYKDIAFADTQIPLIGGQSMLWPKVEARLIQELEVIPTDKVLEIGSGSGYVTALLANLASFVYALDINDVNHKLTVSNLDQAGISNVKVIKADGINGLSEYAPYDKIFVGGGVFEISQELKSQLKIGGKLVGFVGNKPVMHAMILTRISENNYVEKSLFEIDIDYLVNEHISKFKF